MKNLKITTRPQNTITSLAYIETSVDVDDFIKQNPEVKMIEVKFPISGLCYLRAN